MWFEQKMKNQTAQARRLRQIGGFQHDFLYDSALKILELTPIKAKPSNDSETMKWVDEGVFKCNCCIYNMMEGVDYKNVKGNMWVRIELEKGLYGWVESSNTSLSIRRIVGIGKVNGHWKIIMFFSGEPCQKESISHVQAPNIEERPNGLDWQHPTYLY